MSVHGLGLVLALLGSTVVAQDTDLPEQARTVLRDNCLRCHGGDKTKADLKILDYPHLVKADLVVPNQPDDSELFQLVDCGSMPPGTAPKVPQKDREVLRAWIKAGAPPFTPHTGENYIFAQIQKDVRKQNSLKNVRYFSLNHLLDTETPEKMDVFRAALNKAVDLLSPNENNVKLVPIDPERTIFRISIDQAGWNKTPFVPDPKNPKPAIDPETVNLYDLILLEYPLTPLPNTPDGTALAEFFLPMTGMIRPVIYVRGDWFASAALQAPLYGDLLGTKEKSPAKLDADVRLLVQRYARNPVAGAPPLDGLTLPQSEPQNAVVKVDFEVQDAAGKAAAKFQVGTTMTLYIKNTGDKRLYFQVVATTIDGDMLVFGKDRLAKDDKLEPNAATFTPFDIKGKTGREQLTIYASDAPIPPGIVLKAKKDATVSQRVVHPLDKIDFAHAVKKTVEYDVVK